MKTIGILGGLGPESTLEYYSGIFEAFKDNYQVAGFPEMIIHSVNLKEYSKLAEEGKWILIAEKIASRFNDLKKSGADFGFIAANTPHKVFSEIQALTSLPLLSIVGATVDEVKKSGLKRLCLLGTRFTMSSDFYQSAFLTEGIELFTPNAEEQEYIHETIFAELQIGLVKPETKETYLRIIDRIKQKYDTQGVITACTELPLIVKPEDIEQAYLDPTQIHIDTIVDFCRKEEFMEI